MSESSRRDLLERLIHGELAGAEVISQLAALGWDVDEPVVTLTTADALRMLRDYLDDKRTANAVAAWAEALEVREDVEVEAPVQELLFELANPDINGPLTSEVASRWIAELEREAPS